MRKTATIAALIAIGAATSAVAQNSADAPSTTNKPAGEMNAPAPNANSPSPSTAAPAPSTESTAQSPSAASASMKLTDAEAKAWVDKVVYSSDGKNVGEVANFARDADGKVLELHADVGGFLGLGETRVRILPNEFALKNDRVILSIPSDRVKQLPHLPKS